MKVFKRIEITEESSGHDYVRMMISNVVCSIAIPEYPNTVENKEIKLKEKSRQDTRKLDQIKVKQRQTIT